MKKYNHIILFLLLCFGLLLTGCEKRRKRKVVPTKTPAVSTEQAADMTGVLRSIDTAGKLMTFQNISTDEEISFFYSGATSFVSKNDKELSPAQLKPGEVVDIYCEEKAVTKVQISSQIETAENIRNLLVNTDENYVRMGDAKYKYTKGIVAVSNDRPIDMMEITAMDTVTVKYVEGRIFSIIVTKGHGYIKPSHYDDFVGGTMIVEGQTILPVSEQMLVTVPEGTYEVTMKNGNFVGTRKTTVERDEEVNLDMSLFQSQPENTGQVQFDIQPKGAELYVNDAPVTYNKPVSLKYGEHKILVKLEGYSDYLGTLDVESANPTVKIDLAKEKAEVDSGDSSSVTNTPSAPSAPAETVDSKHKITISEPAGVSVYLNGTYKGVAPCSFAKVIGSQTITLSESGYTTKSYTINITDDGEDILWNFPALTKSSTQ